MRKIKDLFKRYRIIIMTSLGIAGVFLLWYIISVIAKTTLLPGPQVVVPLFFTLFADKDIYIAIGGTMGRLLLSVLAGTLLGIVFGLIGGLSTSFRAFFRPFIVIFRTIPTAAIIYIIIALLAPSIAPIIIVFLIIFAIIYDAIVTGVDNVDKSIIEAAKVDGAKNLRLIFKIYLPLSKSYIILGLVSSIGLGMKVAIMSEILAGNSSMIGLGKLIYIASTTVEMDYILAYSLIAIIIIGLVDIVIHFLKKKMNNGVSIKKK